MATGRGKQKGPRDPLDAGTLGPGLELEVWAADALAANLETKASFSDATARPADPEADSQSYNWV